jgi:hypothetical protein
MSNDEDRDARYEEIERRALFALPEEEPDDAPDLLAAARTGYHGGTDAAATPAADLTLGGYVTMHGRAPAFTGRDGQPYTVDVDVERTGDPDLPWSAFLLFIRWAATGAGIMDHCESGDVARGRTEDAARTAALELSLYEVKAELDRAIERRDAARGV